MCTNSSLNARGVVLKTYFQVPVNIVSDRLPVLSLSVFVINSCSAWTLLGISDM